MPSNATAHVIHVPNSHLGPATAHLANHTGPVIRSRRETVHVLHAHYGIDKLVTKPGDVGHLRMLQLIKSARLRSQLEFASTLVAQANRAEADGVADADGGGREELDTKSVVKAEAKSVSIPIPVARPRNSLFDHLMRRDQHVANGHGKHTAGSITSLDGGSDDTGAGGGAKRGARLSIYGTDRRKSGNASAAARKYTVPPPPTASLADSLNEGVLDGASDPLELDVPVLHLHNTRMLVAPVTPQTREAARATPAGLTGGRSSVLTPAASDWEPQSRRPTASGNPKSPKEILDTVFALWTKGHSGRNKSRRSVLPVQQVAKSPQPHEQMDPRRKASVMRQDLTSALQKLSVPSSAASKGSWATGSKPETPEVAVAVLAPSDPPPGKRKSVSIGLVRERPPSAGVVSRRKTQTAPATSETRRLPSRASVSSASAATSPPSPPGERRASTSVPGKGRPPLPPVPISTAPLDKSTDGTSAVKRPSLTANKKKPPPTLLASASDTTAVQKLPVQQAVVEMSPVPHPTVSNKVNSSPRSVAIEIHRDETNPQPSPLLTGNPSLLRQRMSMFSEVGSNDSIVSVSPVLKSPIKSNKSSRPPPRSPLNAGKLLAGRHGLILSRSFASESSPTPNAPDVSNPSSRVNSAGIVVDEDPPLAYTGRRLSIMDAMTLPSSRASSASPTNASGRRASGRPSNQRRSRGIANTLPASAYLNLPSRAMYLIGSASNYSHHRRRRRYKYLLTDLATPLHKSRVAAVTQLADKLGGGKELTAKLVRALCPPDDLLKPISGYFVGAVVQGNLNQFSVAGSSGGGPASANASARTARLLREVAASLSSRRGSASDDKPSRDPFQGLKSRVKAGWSWRERRAMRKVKQLMHGTNRRKQSFHVAVARLAAGHEPKTEIPDVTIEATRRVSMVRTRLGLGSELGSMAFGHVPHKVRPAAMSPDVGKPQPGRPRTGTPKRVVVGENRSLVTKYPQTRERLRADARRLKVNVTRDSSDVLRVGREEKPLSGPGLWFPGALFGQMSEMGM